MMNKEQINKVFGVPVATLLNWGKSRPDYAKYLDKGLLLIDGLPKCLVEEIFSSYKPKQINTLLGLESTFAKTAINITPSTVSDWMANGKNKLYVGLVAGAIVSGLEPILKKHNKTLDDLFEAEIEVTDVVFIWRHRPTALDLVVRSL